MVEGTTLCSGCQEKSAQAIVRVREQLFKSSDVRIVPVDLAIRLGLHNALFLSQLDYWLRRSKHIYFGIPWVYNTYEDWHDQFPFLSYSTVRRIINGLEDRAIVLSKCMNKLRTDRTKWYTLDYLKLGHVVQVHD